MRPRTGKRLRVAVVAVVAVLVAVIAGAAVALAGPIDGHATGDTEVCFWDQFQGIDQESGAGSTTRTYNDINGQTVVVHFSWTADKHLTVWATGGYFTVLRIKAGSGEDIFGPGAGPYTFFWDVDGNGIGNALSHLDFCLWAADEPELGSLRITKTIAGDNPGGLGYGDFTITVTGPNGYSWTGPFDGSGEIVLTDLEPGSYNVSESAPGYPFTVSGEGGVTVSAGQQTGVTITNTGSTTTTLPDPGSLRITKTISGDNPGGLDYEDFFVTVTGPNGYSWYGHFDSSGEIVLTDLEPGSYTIDEDDPAYPFTASGEGGVSVSSNEQTGVTITNTGRTTTTEVQPGSLEITKTIDGDNPGSLVYEDFFVTVTGPNGYSWYGHFDSTGKIVLTNLEPGSYNIDEDDPGYPFTVSGEGGVTVNSEQKTGVTIVNTGSTTTTEAPLGSLLITKTIEGDNPGSLGYEDFEIAVTGPNSYQWTGHFDSNGEIHLTDLEPGSYTINEDDPGYPFTVSGEGGVTVISGQQTGATIVNTGSSTSTTEEVVTSSTTSTTLRTDTTGTTLKSTTTVLGYSSTTVFGWVAQPDDIQTGFGGMAGGSNWALIVLVLAGTMLVSVLVASAMGIRAGVL